MYEFGEFQLDLPARTLRRGGDRITLTAKAFDTLVALLEQAGAVVGKDELMRRIWPDTVVEEANLSQQIFVLRKALGEGPKDQRFIQTVPRRGYRFGAPVVHREPVSASAPSGIAVLRLMLPLGNIPLALGPTSPIAVSPDGRTLVYIAREGACAHLYLRALDRTDSVRVSSLEGASSPFFSPDSRWVGCFADGRLVKVLATGGTPIRICNAGPESRGATWTITGDIVFSPLPPQDWFACRRRVACRAPLRTSISRGASGRTAGRRRCQTATMCCAPSQRPDPRRSKKLRSPWCRS